MFNQRADAERTPLAAFGLVFTPPEHPVDFLDVAVQVHAILTHGQALATVCAAASKQETLEEPHLQQALEILAAYLEAAGQALLQWRTITLEGLQGQRASEEDAI